MTTNSVSLENNIAVPRSPAWGAIIAGAFAGLAIHVLLTMLGTAIGLGTTQPATDENPVATFSVQAALVWTVSALISLWAGGWVAGRCAARVHSVSGGVHGFLVWCVATVAALIMVTTGAGMFVGGAARIVGQGLSAVGNAGSGIADVAKQAAQQSSGAISSMVDESVELSNGKNTAAARREIGDAVRQLFSNGGNIHDPQKRAAVVDAITRTTGVDQTEANRVVDRWTATMERLKNEANQAKTAAEAKARQAADAAARALAQASLWSFIGFLVGAIAASFGGRSGAHWEFRHTEIGADPSLDPAHRPLNIHGEPGHA